MNAAQDLDLAKIRSRISLVRRRRFRARAPIERFRFARLRDAREAPDLTGDASAWPELEWNSYWAGQDVHFALRSAFRAPSGWEGPAALRLPLGTAGDVFSHPEALLRVDGRIAGAADRYHQTVRIDPSLCDGRRIPISLHGWTGYLGWPPEPDDGRRLFLGECALVLLDDDLDEFVELAESALETATLLDDRRPERSGIVQALEAAFRMLDTRHPIDRAFRASVPSAVRALRAGLDRAGRSLDVTLHAVGHAHMDLGYLWPVAETRQKNARTVANALRLMEREPDYRFSHSQPQLYRFLEEDYPCLFEGIRERVAEGRWEVLDGMWVEPDANVPGGEALVRQILLGRRYARDRFGDLGNEILWLPDTFGFPWSLPQLMRQAGLKHFVTGKLSWNQYNKMPFSTALWQGIDGTRVIAQLLTTPREVEHLPHPTVYKSDLGADEVLGTWERAAGRDRIRDLPIAYGYGDGGGGPTEALLRRARNFAAMPGAPRLAMTTAREFFEEVVLGGLDELPVWNDELYLEGHRGVLTSQGWIKRANRKAEQSLHDAEALRVMAGGTDMPETLREAWESLCANQFHDVLAGTAVPQVFEDARADYSRIEALADSVRLEALAELEKTLPDEAEWLSVNTTPVPRRALVEIDAESAPLVDLADGTVLPTQEGTGGRLVELPEQPPLSAIALGSAPVTHAALPPAKWVETESVRGGFALDNDFLYVEVDSQGRLAYVYDHEFERHVLPPGKAGNQLWAFEDRPIQWDAWDVDASFEDRGEEIGGLRSLRVEETGPLRAAVALERRFRDSTIRQTIRLRRDSRRLDFATEVDWRERHTLLKAAFPLHILSPRARYEIQWGEIERPTHRNTSWDLARFEVAAHKWAALGEGGYCVALLNDCKYGYDVRENVMRISLIKSSTMPDPNADQGRHVFTYSLLPHAEGDRELVRREAYDLNFRPGLHGPVRRRNESAAPAAWPDPPPLVVLDAANVVVETVKPSEDGHGYVLRLYEADRRRGPVTLRFGRPIRRVWRCDLLERNLRELKVEENCVELWLRPFEIVSLRCVEASADPGA